MRRWLVVPCLLVLALACFGCVRNRQEAAPKAEPAVVSEAGRAYAAAMEDFRAGRYGAAASEFADAHDLPGEAAVKADALLGLAGSMFLGPGEPEEAFARGYVYWSKWRDTPHGDLTGDQAVLLLRTMEALLSWRIAAEQAAKEARAAQAVSDTSGGPCKDCPGAGEADALRKQVDDLLKERAGLVDRIEILQEMLDNLESLHQKMEHHRQITE